MIPPKEDSSAKREDQLTSQVAINCRGYRDHLTETGAALGELSRETLRRAHWPYNRNVELEKPLE